MEQGTKRGRKKLVPSHRYEYTVNNTNSNSVKWRCTKRNRNNSCPATVKQHGSKYVLGHYGHLHPGVHGVVEDTLGTSCQTKRVFFKAKDCICKGSSGNCNPIGYPRGARIPNPTNLTKIMYLAQSKGRPKEPKKLSDPIPLSYFDIPF